MEEDELDQEATERWKRHPMTVKLRRDLEKQLELAWKSFVKACHDTQDPDVVRAHLTWSFLGSAIRDLGGES